MLLVVVVLTLWRRKVWKYVRDLTVKRTRGVKFHPERFFEGQIRCKSLNFSLS